MRPRTRVLACSAALGAVVLIAVPGGRTFAAEVAAKIAHFRPGGAAGPIPFILDLQKHRRTARPTAKAAKPPTGEARRPQPLHQAHPPE